MTLQERYDEAMFDYSMGDYTTALGKLRAILAESPEFFDAQLSLAMCLYRQGDVDSAIREGLLAEALRPKDPLAQTNLSLFYVKAGDKAKAEHHMAQARMASWRETLAASPPASSPDQQIGDQTRPIPPKPPPPSNRPWKQEKA